MHTGAVIFDMDGVLVDTEPFHFEIARKRFAELGISIPDERLSSFVGISAALMWSGIRREFGLETSVRELVAHEKAAQLEFFQGIHRIPLVPGVIDLLDRVHALGIPCAVASSSSLALVSTILHKTGLAGYFSALASGEEVPNGKPAPDLFITAAERLSVPVDRCLVIEDSPHGIAGALAAGMRTVGFLNPNSGTQDLSGADLVIGEFTPGTIETILSRFDSAS